VCAGIAAEPESSVHPCPCSCSHAHRSDPAIISPVPVASRSRPGCDGGVLCVARRALSASGGVVGRPWIWLGFSSERAKNPRQIDLDSCAQRVRTNMAACDADSIVSKAVCNYYSVGVCTTTVLHGKRPMSVHVTRENASLLHPRFFFLYPTKSIFFKKITPRKMR
jgi:hypothetical protein